MAVVRGRYQPSQHQRRLPTCKWDGVAQGISAQPCITHALGMNPAVRA